MLNFFLISSEPLRDESSDLEKKLGDSLNKINRSFHFHLINQPYKIISADFGEKIDEELDFYPYKGQDFRITRPISGRTPSVFMPSGEYTLVSLWRFIKGGKIIYANYPILRRELFLPDKPVQGIAHIVAINNIIYRNLKDEKIIIGARELSYHCITLRDI